MMLPNVKRIISQLVNNLEIPRNGKSLDEDDSWYLTLSNGSYQNVEIRISNHKTDINTWAFRQYRGQSPSTRISIVFKDNNYAGNVLLHEPVRRQISVTEYVYDLTDGSTLSDKEIAMLTRAIRATVNGSFADPLGLSSKTVVVGKYIAQNTSTESDGDTVPATKWNHGMDNSIEESKTNKNMKKNTIKLNESQLRNVIAEMLNKVLKEGYPNTEEGNADFFAYERQIMSLIDECDDCLLLGRVIGKAANKLSSICVGNRNGGDEWFLKTKQWADRIGREARMLEDYDD